MSAASMALRPKKLMSRVPFEEVIWVSHSIYWEDVVNRKSDKLTEIIDQIELGEDVPLKVYYKGGQFFLDPTLEDDQDNGKKWIAYYKLKLSYVPIEVLNSAPSERCSHLIERLLNVRRNMPRPARTRTWATIARQHEEEHFFDEPVPEEDEEEW